MYITFMSKKLSKKNGSGATEAIAKVPEVINSITENRDVILAQIAELKKMLPQAKKGAKPIQLKFPNGKFTLRELAKQNNVCYATAVSKIHKLTATGELIKLPEVRNNGLGTGRPKWLFQIPEPSVMA